MKGRKAIICASSRGLGRACATALAREGCRVVINGLNPERLAATAADRRENRRRGHPRCRRHQYGRRPHELVAACPDADILVNNNAGPPPGKLADWSHDDVARSARTEPAGAVLVIRAVIGGMRGRHFGRIVNITSAMVKSPHPPMGLSTAARSALTATMQGAVARSGRRQRDDQQPSTRTHRY